jgi:hypothetical protein
MVAKETAWWWEMNFFWRDFFFAAQDLNIHGDIVLTNYPHPGRTILTKKKRLAPVHFQCWDSVFDATQIERIDNRGSVSATVKSTARSMAGRSALSATGEAKSHS